MGEPLDSHVKSRVIWCLSQMERFEFFSGVQLGHKLYVLSDNLPKLLQSEKLSTVSW